MALLGPDTATATTTGTAGAQLATSTTVTLVAGRYVAAVRVYNNAAYPTNVPHGRYYGIATSGGIPIWGGYITDDQTLSFPNLPTSLLTNLILKVWCGTNTPASVVTFKADVYYADSPLGFASIYNERPFTGNGDRISLNVSAPARGTASWQTFVPANNVAWKVRAIREHILTSAVVNTRYIQFGSDKDNTSTIDETAVFGQVGQPASVDGFHEAWYGNNLSTVTPVGNNKQWNYPLWDILDFPNQKAAWGFAFNYDSNVTTGDVTDAIWIRIEEWAGPLPATT